jgi:hypothetical protein
MAWAGRGCKGELRRGGYCETFTADAGGDSDMAFKKEYLGMPLEDWLEEEGILQEATESAVKKAMERQPGRSWSARPNWRPCAKRLTPPARAAAVIARKRSAQRSKRGWSYLHSRVGPISPALAPPGSSSSRNCAAISGIHSGEERKYLI